MTNPKRVEAKPGFEPGVKALQASALPLGHFATWLRSLFKGPVSRPSTSDGADDGVRTRDPDLGKVVLYQLSHVRMLKEKMVGVTRFELVAPTVSR